MFRMSVNSIKLILLKLNILVALSVSSGQLCPPRYPALIAGPGGDDPAQDNGIWYAYRQNGPVTNNQIVTVTGFGPTIDPLTGLSAYRQYTQTAFSTSSQSYACQNQFSSETYIVNGMLTGYQATSSDNYSVIRRNDVNILYHDYTNLIVAYGCGVPKASGTCDTPITWAQTRVKPSQLSAEQMASFDTIINRVFKDYCITLDLLPKQTYNNQAQCPNLEPPACLGGLITGMKETVPQNVTGDTTGAACKWPVYVPAVINYDPARHEGLWYVYRHIWSAGQTAVNMQLTWHILGQGVLPLTNKPGSHVWGELPQYDTQNGTQCSRGYWTGFLASTGENSGFHYVEAADGQVPLRTTTLYADDKYVLYYGCVTPNLQTGLCKDAFGIFCARSDPAHWSQSEKTHVDNDIIGPLFRSYGCSANDFPILPQLRSKPLCSFLGDTKCLRQYTSGFSELVKGFGQSMTNYY